LIPVIAAHHELAHLVSSGEAFNLLLPKIRRVITHDTSITGIARSEGLSSDGGKFYVQNIDQKVEAILAGIGIGHLPRKRIQAQLDQGLLIKLDVIEQPNQVNLMAWKISNKGKGLQVLTQLLSDALA
jgi:DNA-binding transcriptional LysR family regulator